ncbi:MAG: hypothetical protein H6R15_1440 [Proteobacteria bacterium]|nr:hypothetical protein [Pseudomonadota bacterium]
MALQILKGRIARYTKKRDVANFVFTDDDRATMGVVAIAASLAGLSGQAISTATVAASTEEEADYLEFELEGMPVKGWVWRSPFKEGDEVEVAAEWQEEHYELYAAARPIDRTLALYPHCSRASKSHWRNIQKWWLQGTSAILLLGGGMMEVYGRSFYSWSPFFNEKMGAVMVLSFVAFFYPMFALMAWSLGRKWMPFVRLSEKIFSAFGWKNSASIDLVKRSKELRRKSDPADYGVFYFRY